MVTWGHQQQDVKTTLEGIYLWPVEEMPWAKPGGGQDTPTLQVTGVGTVMGCRDGCLSIVITTFLALNLWFVVIFWLVLFYYLLFFHSACLFFPSSISVVFSPFPFSVFKAAALKNFFS